MRNLFRYVGWRHLRMRPVRTVLTTLGVAFGIALFVAIDIINHSTLNSFRESIDAVAGKTTLSVTAGETGFPEGVVDQIQKVPGVKSAAPVVESRGYFAGERASESLEIMGVDLLREQSVRTYRTCDGASCDNAQVIDDPLTFLNQPDSIILTNTFAREHGLKLDSHFELATTRGPRQFTVRGLLSPDGPAKAFGGGIAIMDIDGARMTFGKEGKVDRVDVLTAEGADVEHVKTLLESALGAGYAVERPSTQGENMTKMVKSFQLMLTVFSSLALVVGLFLVANSVNIAVAERRREIGTLRAVGATRRGILALFMVESTLMGTVGAAIGAAMGKRLAGVMVDLVSLSLARQQMIRVEIHHLDFETGQLVRALLIGAGAAFVAALVPSYRATRISPLEAMRRSEAVVEGKPQGFARLSPWLGCMLICYYGVSSNFHWAVGHPILEFMDQAASMLGAAFVGPAIVTGLVRVLSPLALPLGGAVMRLADDNLLRNPRRTGSNVMSLMVGLMLVTMIATVNISFRTTILNWFDRLFRADLVVSASGKLISFQTQPVAEELAKELSAVPGVRNGPRTGAYAMRFIHLRYEGRQIAIKAYDTPDWDHPAFSLDLHDTDGEEAAHALFSNIPTVLVSSNFVMHFHKGKGDTIEFPTPTGIHSFKIAGMIQDFASSEGVVYMNRDIFKTYWNDSLVSTFSLVLEPGADPQTVRREIDQRFGRSRNLMTVSNTELKQQMSEVVDQSFAYTQAIKLVALLVGLLGLFNTFLISVMERTRELGMLRAVGMSRVQTRRMILLEALIQGGFGALAATFLGACISWLWVRGSLAYVLGWIIEFHFPWNAVGATVLAGTGVALIAALFPAHRAAQLEIREALEYE